MKSYSVRMTRRALEDMEAIYTYIADELQSPENAMGQYDRIADAIEGLSSYPLRHRLFDSQPERQLGFRLMPVDHFAVIYVTGETDVTILRVLYGKSDIIGRLREER